MAAGPETTSTYADLLLEMRGPLVKNYPTFSVLLSELARNTNQKNFSGSQVRVPIIKNVKQGTGFVSEGGTLNVARNLNTSQAHINVVTQTHAVKVSRRLQKVSGNDLTSWAEAMKLEMQAAEEAMPAVANDALNGSGDGKLCAISSTTSGAATVTVDATTANFDLLYIGRVVDILATSDGTAVTNGSGREITAVNESTGVITFGDSGGNLSVSSSNAIYIEGSYGNVCQGIQQAVSATGTFENIDKAANAWWQGVDASPSSTSDLSISIMDGAVRKRGRNGKPPAGFWLGDPAVIDKFGQTLLAQARWNGEYATLSTGWKGIEYRGEMLMPEYAHVHSQITFVPKEDVTFYATSTGPDWDREDGALFKRFARQLPVEAWLVDEYQLGVHRCNRFVKVGSLNRAS